MYLLIPYMKWFKDITDKDFNLVGGKGFNLAKLAKKFDVPNGFVITTEEELDDNKIIDYSKGLGKVAVRSSATAEDLPDASFAGQHDSFLDVTEDSLIDSIRKCQESIDTERAKFYREQKGIKESKMAVVVQKMVDAEYAGVMFTVDPIHKKHILIEVVKGLGEKLVSGEVTPNTFFLDNEFEIVQENVVFDMDKTILKELAKLGLEVQEHFGKPQDIEFCIENEKIWLVQSRDITTL